MLLLSVVVGCLIWYLWFAANFAGSSFVVFSPHSRIMVSNFPVLTFSIPLIGLSLGYVISQIQKNKKKIRYELLQTEEDEEEEEDKPKYTKLFLQIEFLRPSKKLLYVLLMLMILTILCIVIVLYVQKEYEEVDICVQGCEQGDDCLIDRAFPVDKAEEPSNSSAVNGWLSELLGESLHEPVSQSSYIFTQKNGSEELLIGFGNWFSMLGENNASTLLFTDNFTTIGASIKNAMNVLEELRDSIVEYDRRIIGGCSVRGKKALFTTALMENKTILTHLVIISGGGIGAALGTVIGICGETAHTLTLPSRHLDWFRNKDEVTRIPSFGTPYDMDDVLLNVVLSGVKVHMYSSVYDLWSNPLGTFGNYISVQNRLPEDKRHCLTMHQANSPGHCPNINFSPYSFFYQSPSIPKTAIDGMREFINGNNGSTVLVEQSKSERTIIKNWLEKRL